VSKREVLHVSSSSQWEEKVGYSRVIKYGNHIEVAGTIATDLDGSIVGPGDVYLQTKYIIEKVKAALQYADSNLEQVVRTRVFTTKISFWEDIGRAHHEYFKNVKPAMTLVEVSKLIMPKALVEIEFTALA
jgi:enamine deaminase RidA (YjgF/YER057c/UK114 family)